MSSDQHLSDIASQLREANRYLARIAKALDPEGERQTKRSEKPGGRRATVLS